MRPASPRPDGGGGRVARQAYAGLLWSKQFFHFSVKDWLEGDPSQPPPPERRKDGRNSAWTHLYNRDVISMPDKWEYPWYAAWDLAFHMVPFARIDPEFAKQQIILLLREWYMHPNGQIPAYEWAFGDVNPPVHAWAAWRIYKITGTKGNRDRVFLARVFQKLLINFTWWVNRKDPEGKNLFAGGFLGLDNIGVFDRSAELPTGGHLEQADGTAWMALLLRHDAVDGARAGERGPGLRGRRVEVLRAFRLDRGRHEHARRNGSLGRAGRLLLRPASARTDGNIPLKVRSMVGLIPLFAVEVLEDDVTENLPGFRKRMQWFLDNRRDLACNISYMARSAENREAHRLLAIPSRERLRARAAVPPGRGRVPFSHGIRALSRVHRDAPYTFRVGDQEHVVAYDPGESTTGVFGGNSNWRGPVWFPVNYLLVEALQRYHHFYGDGLRVECPTGSGVWMNLGQVSREIAKRLAALFLPDAEGAGPATAATSASPAIPRWSGLVLFHEYFHGDTGRGVGASHQTGWTAIVVRCLEDLAAHRRSKGAAPGSGPAVAPVRKREKKPPLSEERRGRRIVG